MRRDSPLRERAANPEVKTKGFEYSVLADKKF